jgi:hypothetical protein
MVNWAAAGLFAALAVLGLVLRRRRGAEPQAVAAAEAPVPNGDGPVRRYRAADNDLPPEVIELGQAESIHRACQWLRLARKQPVVFVVGGLALAVGTVVVLSGVELPAGKLQVIFYLPIIAGLFIAALPYLTKDLVTYIVFPSHFVLVHKNDFVLIPWDAIKQLTGPRDILTCDGQHFQLENTVDDMGRLYHAVHSRLRERLLPPALAVIERGEELTLGPVTLSSTAISCNGKTLPWSRAGSIQMGTHLQTVNRNLNVWERGTLWPTIMINLNTVPNDWLLVELVRYVCPRQLRTKDWTR